jgi:hypothetical protein
MATAHAPTLVASYDGVATRYGRLAHEALMNCWKQVIYFS